MQAIVKIYAKRTDILVLEVTSPKYIDINGVLRPQQGDTDTTYQIDSTNWRNLKLPSLKEASLSNYKQNNIS